MKITLKAAVLIIYIFYIEKIDGEIPSTCVEQLTSNFKIELNSNDYRLVVRWHFNI